MVREQQVAEERDRAVAVACKQCHWCARHVANINVWGNIGLLGVKLVGGIFGRSHALIADAVHSLSDGITSLVFLVGLKVSAAPPDEDHHWGHGNVEFIVSAIMGVFLISAAVGITVVSVTSILEGATPEPDVLAVGAAAISVVVNEIMFRHSMCIGKQLDSPAMIANALENRADVYTSAAALIGVFGARMGLTFLDPVAAIAVGFMIARTGVVTLKTGIKGSTDQLVDRTVLAAVKRIVSEEKAIRCIRRLRARKVGQKSWIDFEAEFDPEMKVSEVKEIVDRLRKNIMDELDRTDGVTIVPRVALPELGEIEA